MSRSEPADAAPPPRFIRLMASHPCACLLFWTAVPLLMALQVFPKMVITAPYVGWRIREHPTAAAFDSLILATRQAGPPKEHGRSLSEEHTSSAAEERKSYAGSVVLIFTRRDGGNVLSYHAMREMARLQRVAAGLVRDVCQLDGAAGSRGGADH